MVDDIFDSSGQRGRVEIRTGVGRRRRWSEEQKGRIVAQSYAPGAIVSEVARRHEISPQHLFGWRKAARAGLLALPSEERPMFVPVVTPGDCSSNVDQAPADHAKPRAIPLLNYQPAGNASALAAGR